MPLMLIPFICAMPPIPISAIVLRGNGSMGGIAAVMPIRGARAVARVVPAVPVAYSA